MTQDSGDLFAPLPIQILVHENGATRDLSTSSYTIDTVLDWAKRWAGRVDADDPGLPPLLAALGYLRLQQPIRAGLQLYDWVKLTKGHAFLITATDGEKQASLVVVQMDMTMEERIQSLYRVYQDYPKLTAVWLPCIMTLARVLASYGMYDDARSALSLLHDWFRDSHIFYHWITSTQKALEMLEEGEALPPYLQRLVGDDTDYFAPRTCPEAFNRFDLHTNGDVLVCCGHWLKASIGNLEEVATYEEVLNSELAQDIRRSISDGSYIYCDAARCGSMILETLPRRDDLTFEQDGFQQGIKAFETKDYKVDAVGDFIFAFDESCNLSCPSCRSEVKIDRREIQERRIELITQHVLPTLKVSKSILLNTAGEVFASKSSMALLKALNKDDYPDLTVNIITNGTLLDRKTWEDYPGIHGMIGYIRVSVDGATKPTVEKLRRKAHFEVLSRNLEFYQELKEQGLIQKLMIAFTYQLENYREMPAFVAWGQRLGADQVLFEKLENIAFAPTFYRELAVHLPHHPEHDDFLEVLKDPLMKAPGVLVR